MYSGKKAQHDFPKMRGGGIKGRLELFQKFIRFGRAALPLLTGVKCRATSVAKNDDCDWGSDTWMPAMVI